MNKSNNNFGISNNSYLEMISVLKHFGKIKKVIVFGSRAMGNYKPGIDIDLDLNYKSNTEFEEKFKLISKLKNGANIAYNIDVIDYEEMDNLKLKEHIDTFGVEIKDISKNA